MTAEIVVLSPIEGERKRPIEGERKRLLFLVANALILWMIHGTIVSRCRCGARHHQLGKQNQLGKQTPNWKKTQFCNFVFPIRPAPCGISSLKN